MARDFHTANWATRFQWLILTIYGSLVSLFFSVYSCFMSIVDLAVYWNRFNSTSCLCKWIEGNPVWAQASRTGQKNPRRFPRYQRNCICERFRRVRSHVELCWAAINLLCYRRRKAGCLPLAGNFALIITNQPGRIVKTVFTEVQGLYQDAGEDLRRNLNKFNNSLEDVNLLIGIGSTSIWFH